MRRALHRVDDVRPSPVDTAALGAVGIRARVTGGRRRRGGTLERAERLTAYAVELIAGDALHAGPGARLELVVTAGAVADTLMRVRERFATLCTRGVTVVVRAERNDPE